MNPPEKLFQDALNALNKHNLFDAERLLKKFAQRQPKHFEGLNLLAIVLMLLERHAEAEPYIKAALNLNAKNDATLSNYGTILKSLNRPREALERFSQALAINPSNSVTWHNRGTVLYDLKRYADAITDFDKATFLDPRFYDAFCSKGNSLGQLKRYDEALTVYDKALSLKPDLAEAWHGRGTVFSELGRHDEAFAAFDKAFSLKSDLTEVEGLRLHSKMHLCDWSDFTAECGHLIASVRHNKENTAPFAFLAINSSAEEQIHCARMWTQKKYPRSNDPLWRSEVYKHDKIRIGYVSADFHQHATAYLMAGMFECHDKSRFEITAISIGVTDNSAIRDRLRSSFHKFIDARELSDDEVAAQIKTAEIDILVDLKGFTQNARTEIFARRPAPIQVNYLGYPGTMGASYIDYIIGDPVLIPASHQCGYAEKIVYLPHSYQANDAKRQISDNSLTRSEHGLPDGKFVFCCFNNNYKILPDIFDRWMRLLKQIEGSVLWLFEANATAATNIKKEAVARGVDAERIVFAKRMPLPEHLARHRLANLFLDTLPYNAHTTASDALWAGLPVLTQIGETFASRVCASLLNAIGLPELIAQTQEQYEKMAIELASKPEKLAAITTKLAENRLTMPLFNTQLFTQHIENAYVEMYERYQKGLPPDHIYIPDRSLVESPST